LLAGEARGRGVTGPAASGAEVPGVDGRGAAVVWQAAKTKLSSMMRENVCFAFMW